MCTILTRDGAQVIPVQKKVLGFLFTLLKSRSFLALILRVCLCLEFRFRENKSVLLNNLLVQQHSLRCLLYLNRLVLYVFTSMVA